MSIEAEFRAAVLRLVPELVAMVRAELGRPRMLPIRETPIAYRALLAAEKRGELTVYRVGHAALVDEAELYEWIRRVGTRCDESSAPPEPADEIGALIELGDKRRSRRARVA